MHDLILSLGPALRSDPLALRSELPVRCDLPVRPASAVRAGATRHLPAWAAAVAMLGLLGCSGTVESDQSMMSAGQQATYSLSSGNLETAPSASWHLEAPTSYLSVVSVKQTNVAEVHTFERYDASISELGQALVSVDLSSIVTGAELRDQRLRDFLFEVDLFPRAEIEVSLDAVALNAMTPGSTAVVPGTAVAHLHGLSHELSVTLVVSRLTLDTLTVQPSKPLVLMVTDFGMAEGIATLVELASLESISAAVPIDFLFTLKRQQAG